jgi:hypothetical protein
MRRSLLSGVLIGVCVQALGASAQTRDEVSRAVSDVTPSTRVFKAGVNCKANAEQAAAQVRALGLHLGQNLVALSVTVTDGQERHVPGLSSDDFAVFENGAPQEIATQTGGRAYFRLDPARDLARTCRAIARELSSQYSPGYVSTDSREDGQFRQVQVRMRHPADARARTRPGYYATHHPALTRRPAAGPQEGVTTQ